MTEPTDDKLLELTASLIGAALANNIDLNDLPQHIARVHLTLAGLGKAPAPKPEPKPEPKAAKPKVRAMDAAIPIMDPQEAITHDHLTCLICGRQTQLMKVHLRKMHDMNPDQYRDMYGLPASYPMTPESYRQMAARRVRDRPNFRSTYRKETPEHGATRAALMTR